jgi:hypothetical protein
VISTLHIIKNWPVFFMMTDFYGNSMIWYDFSRLLTLNNKEYK